MEFLEKFGWPTFALVSLVTFFYKGIWPIVIERLRKADEHRDKLDEIMRQSAKDCEVRCETITKEFLEALNKLQLRADRNSDHLASNTEKLADNNRYLDELAKHVKYQRVKA